MTRKAGKTTAKRYDRMAKAMLKGKVVVFVVGQNNGKVQLWDVKREKVVPITVQVAKALHEGRFPWVVHATLACRQQGGDQYAPVAYLPAPSPVTQAQIADSCSEKHLEMMKTINKNHLLTAAWVASPEGVELSEKAVYEIIETFGAFEFYAKWEQKEHEDSSRT